MQPPSLAAAAAMTSKLDCLLGGTICIGVAQHFACRHLEPFDRYIHRICSRVQIDSLVTDALPGPFHQHMLPLNPTSTLVPYCTVHQARERLMQFLLTLCGMCVAWCHVGYRCNDLLFFEHAYAWACPCCLCPPHRAVLSSSVSW
jgi:hypothetical protein